MKRPIPWIFALLLVQSIAWGEVPRSIFDDDWQPAPAAQPAPPAGPSESQAPAVPPPSTQSVSSPPATLWHPAFGGRIAVPSTAAQADAWKLIKGDLYKDDIANARTAAQKVKLARKLLEVAAETKNDMVGKYVLLAQAKELAIGSGDPATAFQCLTEIGKSFEIDYPLQKLELFSALTRTVSTPSDCQALAEGLNRWADGQVKIDRYDSAKKACEMAATVAHKTSVGGLANRTLLHEKEVAEIESAYSSAKAVMATLASKPSDSAANLDLGRFYCFMKGDWNKGLPMLARGSDDELKNLAEKEVAGVSGTDSKVALADEWWGEVDKQGKRPEQALTRDRIREHAIRWYSEALPNLVGLARARVQKRLNITYLSDLTEQKISCWHDDKGRVAFGKNGHTDAGAAISVDGVDSPKGIYSHPPSHGYAIVTYAINRKYKTFSCKVGIDDGINGDDAGAVVFKIAGDGHVLWTSQPIARKGTTDECTVDVEGVKELELVAECAGVNYWSHAVWVEPRLEGFPPGEKE